jgi:hypothetical protein
MAGQLHRDLVEKCRRGVELTAGQCRSGGDGRPQAVGGTGQIGGLPAHPLGHLLTVGDAAGQDQCCQLRICEIESDMRCVERMCRTPVPHRGEVQRLCGATGICGDGGQRPNGLHPDEIRKLLQGQ